MGRSFCVSMIGDSFLLRQSAVLHEAEQIAERLLFYKDRADFCVFCVTEPRGDAYAAMVYAREKQKPLCNLFGMLPEQKEPLAL